MILLIKYLSFFAFIVPIHFEYYNMVFFVILKFQTFMLCSRMTLIFLQFCLKIVNIMLVADRRYQLVVISVVFMNVIQFWMELTFFHLYDRIKVYKHYSFQLLDFIEIFSWKLKDKLEFQLDLNLVLILSYLHPLQLQNICLNREYFFSLLISTIHQKQFFYQGEISTTMLFQIKNQVNQAHIDPELAISSLSFTHRQQKLFFYSHFQAYQNQKIHSFIDLFSII